MRKSSRSLPAVNTPEPPVMMMQRISGLFCAVSIASLMARYMSWVIAFFFSGRRSVITRVASSSVTMRCPVMKLSLKTGGDNAAGESSDYILHDPLKGPNRRTGFPGKSPQGSRHAADRNSPFDGDIDQAARKSGLLHRPARHAAGQEDGQPGQRLGLPSVLCRRQSQSGDGPHLLRFPGLRRSGAGPIRSRAPACASPAKRRLASGATA